MAAVGAVVVVVAVGVVVVGCGLVVVGCGTVVDGDGVVVVGCGMSLLAAAVVVVAASVLEPPPSSVPIHLLGAVELVLGWESLSALVSPVFWCLPASYALLTLIF